MTSYTLAISGLGLILGLAWGVFWYRRERTGHEGPEPFDPAPYQIPKTPPSPYQKRALNRYADDEHRRRYGRHADSSIVRKVRR